MTIQETPPPLEDRSKAKKLKKRRFSCCWWLLAVVVVIYVTIPFLVRYSIRLQSALIYVNFIKTPWFGNISNPAEFGLQRTRQFELFHGDGCEVTVWQVLPNSYWSSHNLMSTEDYLKAFSDGAPIVLYLHGNTGTRATPHRVDLYKYLAGDKGYHVITFDYRGYADSRCYPSETGMMEDAHLVWKWVKQYAPSSKLYTWGHSLGSAAATYLAKELCENGNHQPSGLILDAPFTNMVDAGSNHPFGIPFWPIMPLFRYFVLESFPERFESSERLKHISCPVLILHGRKDVIIPFHLGQKMYSIALESRKANPKLGNVTFVDCGETAHKTNYQSPHIGSALNNLIKGN